MDMVLCITHSNDFYTIDIVQQQLQELGMAAFRFNSDEFPVHYQLNYFLQKKNRTLFLETGDQRIYASDIKGVWYRKLWNFKISEDLDPTYALIYNKEYQAYLQMFFDSLHHVPWMNAMQADHFVGNNKLHQLSVASAMGIRVPETIFTNTSSTVKDFYPHFSNGVIVKLHGALSKSMDGNAPFFPTTKLSAADLLNLDLLAYCPMIFQEYIPKEYELRIAYVDGVCFAGQIPLVEESTDWRTRQQPIKWQPYELPFEVQEKLRKLMRALKLTFGAIDIIKSQEGEYVFLEVNPQGEWGMLQKYLNYPIGETIAQKLINRIKNDKEESTHYNTYK